MKNNLITPEFEKQLLNLKVFCILRYDLDKNVFVLDIVDNKLQDIRTGVFFNDDVALLRAGKKTQIII